ncbi:hypothetical protein [Leisingera sp. ANG-M1]|uniref:hypothetical protein n=1 Tax=Leisingera sp. ANG-M1 TaxID=1577895 RepID=UPI00126A27FE|nr:hypothetical protein [Leisingera sp. ANG-M1]
MAPIVLDLRNRPAIKGVVNAKVPLSSIAVEISSHRSPVCLEIAENSPRTLVCRNSMAAKALMPGTGDGQSTHPETDTDPPPAFIHAAISYEGQRVHMVNALLSEDCGSS